MRRLALICIIVLMLMTLTTLRTGNREVVQQGVKQPVTLKTNKASISEIVKAAASTYNLPASLISAIIKAESGFDPKAISNKGAVGLMQLSLSTRKAMNVTNPFDPVQNILAGARYLRHLIDRFHGNVEMAVAAYNAGPAAVERHGGIPPYRQTQAFVPKVMGYYSEFESGTAID